jgi:hypothetical protein
MRKRWVIALGLSLFLLANGFTHALFACVVASHRTSPPGHHAVNRPNPEGASHAGGCHDQQTPACCAQLDAAAATSTVNRGGV